MHGIQTYHIHSRQSRRRSCIEKHNTQPLPVAYIVNHIGDAAAATATESDVVLHVRMVNSSHMREFAYRAILTIRESCAFPSSQPEQTQFRSIVVRVR